MRKRKDPLIRFEKKFYKTVGGCWNWQGATQSIGYGMMGMFDEQNPEKPMVMQLAHRLAYQFYIGPIPEGMDVLHHCDNRRCVNPDHLFIGTAQDNVDDMMEKGRHTKIHLRGEEHARHILSWVQVRAIRASTLTIEKLAERYNVNHTTIHKILTNTTWHDPNYTYISRKPRSKKVNGGTLHPASKLNIEQVREIRSTRTSAYQLAKKFGVSNSTIYDVRNNKKYREDL